jgi:hypothetical protein
MSFHNMACKQDCMHLPAAAYKKVLRNARSTVFHGATSGSQRRKLLSFLVGSLILLSFFSFFSFFSHCATTTELREVHGFFNPLPNILYYRIFAPTEAQLHFRSQCDVRLRNRSGLLVKPTCAVNSELHIQLTPTRLRLTGKVWQRRS